MNTNYHSKPWRERTLVLLPVLCAVIAFFAFADDTADAVMLKKPKTVPAPSQSFLLDVLPVKETKAVDAKPKVAPREVAPVPEMPKKASVVEQPVVSDKPLKPLVAEDAAVDDKPAATPVIPVEKQAAKVEEIKQEASPKDDAVKGDASKASAKKDKKDKIKAKKPARDAIITADRTDYDRKEGVVLFDRNVHVDDEQYKMHADRLFLFLEGTNELKRLVALGHVAITNDDKRAYCAKATFNKKLGRIVMYSSDEITAQLHEEGKKGSDVKGEKITFWLDSEQVEVENPIITMPGGFGGRGEMKKLIGK